MIRRIAFCRIQGRNQKPFYLNALLQNCLIVTVSTFNQQFQPILTFRTLFQRNLKLCHKVRPAMGIECFSNIGPNAGSRPNQLICQLCFPSTIVKSES